MPWMWRFSDCPNNKFRNATQPLEAANMTHHPVFKLLDQVASAHV